MLKLAAAEMQSAFYASIELISRPRSCFQDAKDGYLEVAGVGAFSYWLYVTLLEALLFLLTSKTSTQFSIWYFAIIAVGSLIRMIGLLTIWMIVAKLFRLKEIRPVVSICLFATALFSFFMYVFLLFPMHEVGLEAILSDGAAPQLGEQFRVNYLIVLFLMVSSPFYIAIYVSGAYSLSYKLSLAFVWTTMVVYAIFRPFTVGPLSSFLSRLLIERPWSG